MWRNSDQVKIGCLMLFPHKAGRLAERSRPEYSVLFCTFRYFSVLFGTLLYLAVLFCTSSWYLSSCRLYMIIYQ